MKEVKGIILNGEWLGNKVLINGMFNAICAISPIVLQEFVRIINKIEELDDVYIKKYSFPNGDSINIEFTNSIKSGAIELDFALENNLPVLKNSTVKLDGYETSKEGLSIDEQNALQIQETEEQEGEYFVDKNVIDEAEPEREQEKNVEYENILSENLEGNVFSEEGQIEEEPSSETQYMVTKETKENFEKAMLNKLGDLLDDTKNIINDEKENNKKEELLKEDSVHKEEIPLKQECFERDITEKEEIIAETETETEAETEAGAGAEIETKTEENTPVITGNVYVLSVDKKETLVDEDFDDIELENSNNLKVDNEYQEEIEKEDFNDNIYNFYSEEESTEETIDEFCKENICEDTSSKQNNFDYSEYDEQDIDFQTEDEIAEMEEIETEDITNCLADFYANPEKTESELVTFDNSMENMLDEIISLKKELGDLKDRTGKRVTIKEIEEILDKRETNEEESVDFRIMSSKERVSACKLDEDLFVAGDKLYKWGDILYLED
jgi:hypothetical protein